LVQNDLEAAAHSHVYGTTQDPAAQRVGGKPLTIPHMPNHHENNHNNGE
jgi:hypothetical protein